MNTPKPVGEYSIPLSLVEQDGVSANDKIKCLIINRNKVLRDHMALLSRHALGCESIEAECARDAFDLIGVYNPQVTIISTAPSASSALNLSKHIWHHNALAKVIVCLESVSHRFIEQFVSVCPPGAIYGLVLDAADDTKWKYALSSVVTHDNVYVDPQIRLEQHSKRHEPMKLSALELETITQIALGMTDRAIAMRSSMSVRGINSRVAALYDKIVSDEEHTVNEILGLPAINPRSRLIFHALHSGIIDFDTLEASEESFNQWIATLGSEEAAIESSDRDSADKRRQ
jgi:DNA-binding NarL/FixJ family response regulator